MLPASDFSLDGSHENMIKWQALGDKGSEKKNSTKGAIKRLRKFKTYAIMQLESCAFRVWKC